MSRPGTISEMTSLDEPCGLPGAGAAAILPAFRAASKPRRAISGNSNLTVGRRRGGRRATDGAERAAAQRADRCSPAAARDAADRRAGAGAEQAAADRALAGVVGVAAGEPEAQASQNDRRGGLSVHASSP